MIDIICFSEKDNKKYVDICTKKASTESIQDVLNISNSIPDSRSRGDSDVIYISGVAFIAITLVVVVGILGRISLNKLLEQSKFGCTIKHVLNLNIFSYI